MVIIKKFLIAQKEKIYIKLSKRLYGCHIYEIELKKDKTKNDFTYLIGKARYLFHYLYSLEKSKGKLNVLFLPIVSVVWDSKLTFKHMKDYIGPIYSGFCLPTLSLKTFFSNFNSIFSELVYHDKIVNHNCENIKDFLAFIETEFFSKEGRASVNSCEPLTSVDDRIEKYFVCKENEFDRKIRKKHEKVAKLYRAWKEKNNIDEDEGEEDNENVITFYEEIGIL